MVTQEQVIEALGSNPELAAGILPTFKETDAFKTLLNNQVNITYKEKIGEEIKNVHGKYDEQFQSILGKVPGQKEDGTKQKTYEFLGDILNDYKGLDAKRDSFSKDTEVLALKSRIEKMTKTGGNEYLNNLLTQTKAAAASREEELQGLLTKERTSNESFKKSSVIKSGIAELKLNPDIPASLSAMALKLSEENLLKNSKLDENGNLVFLDKDGKPDLNPATLSPKTALEMLTGLDSIKGITLKENHQQRGGGADKTIVGNIETIKTEGKGSQERLNIPSGTFRTQVEFNDVVEKILQQDGILKTDLRYFPLKDKAFIENNVGELPQ